MEPQISDRMYQFNGKSWVSELYDSTKSRSKYQEESNDMSIMRAVEDIDSLCEGVEGVLNQLKAEGIASKLDAALVGEKAISGDILRLNESLGKISTGVKKLQSSVCRLAEKTSKRMKAIKIIQILTLLLLLSYIAYELYQKYGFLTQ
jgi:hypothetical protein